MYYKENESLLLTNKSLLMKNKSLETEVSALNHFRAKQDLFGESDETTKQEDSKNEELLFAEIDSNLSLEEQIRLLKAIVKRLNESNEFWKGVNESDLQKLVNRKCQVITNENKALRDKAEQAEKVLEAEKKARIDISNNYANTVSEYNKLKTQYLYVQEVGSKIKAEYEKLKAENETLQANAKRQKANSDMTPNTNQGDRVPTFLNKSTLPPGVNANMNKNFDNRRYSSISPAAIQGFRPFTSSDDKHSTKPSIQNVSHLTAEDEVELSKKLVETKIENQKLQEQLRITSLALNQARETIRQQSQNYQKIGTQIKRIAYPQ